MRGGRRRDKNAGENAGMADWVSGKCGSTRAVSRAAHRGARSARGKCGGQRQKRRRKRKKKGRLGFRSADVQ